MNTSCMKSIKASSKVKPGSKSRMWGMSEYTKAEKEAKKRLAEQRQVQGQSPEQELLRNNLLEGLGKLCLNASGLLLLKASLARRRQEQGLRLHLQHKHPR